MNKQKGIASIILIIIIIAVLAFVGFFVYQYFFKSANVCWPYCNNMTDKDRDQIKNDALTATGWKTYTNSQYGFEVKYPSNLEVKPSINPSGFDLSFSGVNGSYVDGGGNVELRVFNNLENKTAVQYFSDKKNAAIDGFASKCSTCAIMDQDAKLFDCLENNSDTLKIGNKIGYSCKNPPQSEAYLNPTYVFNGGYIYEFINYNKTNPSYEIYNQILSTFKFTK